jgi:hypothetical protein
MLLQSLFPDRETITRLHWFGQIALLLAVGVALVFLSVARSGAATGNEPIPGGVCSPAELCALLRQEETRFNAISDGWASKCLPDKLKAVREGIQYSLPQAGPIGTLPDYVSFAESVEQVCKILSANNPATGLDEDRLRQIEIELAGIQSKITYMSSVLKR